MARPVPDRIRTVPGPRGKPWTIREIFAGPLTADEAWARVEPLLVRVLLPKAREIIERDRAKAAPTAEYIAEGAD